MFSVITKDQYWAALDDEQSAARLETTKRTVVDLKHVQDAWILSQLCRMRGKRMLEIGGGYARVLRTLDGNERWNLDRLDGDGSATISKRIRMPADIKLVRAYLGEFSEDVPSDYFDVVFSISVLEHVPLEAGPALWRDHARVMTSGGVAYHAIDLYVGDEPIGANEARLDAYISGIQAAGLKLIDQPTVERPLVFRCAFATNSDLAMRHWNMIAPGLAKLRRVRQSVSLGVALVKP